MSYSQFAASSQFFLYGKKHFNQTGYIKHTKENEEYKKDVLYKGNLIPLCASEAAFGNERSLADKVFMVTGANSGIGKEITKALAARGCTMYMLCRNAERAEKARAEVVEATKNPAVYVIQCDCSLESSVREAWAKFLSIRGANAKLDGLVCNAGVLLNERACTSEGVEITMACHLLFGTYLLGTLALPALETAKGRLVVVTSGGMYNTKYPGFDLAASRKGKYNGNLSYAYAKRGQVILATQWAKLHPNVKVVSAHPGWTLTEAVDAAYGDSKKYLEPMRTPWQGAEGISWLMYCNKDTIESGACYLDRKPQTKHMAGPFFTEGSFTKNTAGEVDCMMADLEKWSSSFTRPDVDDLKEFDDAKAEIKTASNVLCKAMDTAIDTQQFMGKWYVIAHIPTIVDKGTANNTEDYVWDDLKKRIDVTFSYSNQALTKTSSIKQVGTVVNDANTEWKLSVKMGFIPLSFPYLILDCADDYSTCIVGEPKRSFLYIMARTAWVSEATLNVLRAKAMRLGHDDEKIVKVTQNW